VKIGAGDAEVKVIRLGTPCYAMSPICSTCGQP